MYIIYILMSSLSLDPFGTNRLIIYQNTFNNDVIIATIPLTLTLPTIIINEMYYLF